MTNKQLTFWLTHCKLLIHYLFRTKRFGFNNEWWAKKDFFLGWDFKKQFWSTLKICPIYRNYWYAMTDENFKLAYGWTKAKYLETYYR